MNSKMRMDYVDCERTNELIRLRNNYLALREVNENDELLDLATLDENGRGMRFLDAYFERFGNCEDDGSRSMGYLKYSIMLYDASKRVEEKV
ncbi:MAG TPA: hypothetical protein ENH99_02315 [Candidatus Pacearchaeota archaeon]|nr:hypothetical protein [Candidatus Pacearchaeota archaeon]